MNLRIDLVAMAEAQADARRVVEQPGRQRAGLELDILSAKPHVPAQPFDLLLLGQNIDHAVLALGLELAASWRP